jgi:hypothetical protein
MKRVLFLLLVLVAVPVGRAAETNLVANGSFEESRNRPGLPDDWAASGNRAVKQQLVLDTGRDGKRCARLVCAEFQEGGPDHHAMICQVGKVSVRRGQWYRLTFWARGQDIKEGAVEIGLSNMRPWEGVGLAEAFRPRSQWQQYEFLFRARADLPAANSRLQFWFRSTGTLWLDDVTLTTFAAGQQWYPSIGTDKVKNFVPNSSFECGTANWGSFTWGLSGWAGNLYRLEGDVDSTQAQHGRHCLKIALGPCALPVFWFDYYEPVRQPVRRVLAANQGWFRVRPGEKLTLSAFLRADVEKVTAQLAAIEAPSSPRRKAVSVGTQWQRHEFTFTPAQPFLFIAVGLDLEASQREEASLWVDAVQLERGDRATAYEPRHEVEAFVQTSVPGNVFDQVARGATFQVRAFNDSGEERSVQGQLAVTDFHDRHVLSKDITLAVPAHAAANSTLAQVCQGRRGFFRANWKTAGTTQSLRCAIIEPISASATDSPLGFNHAYPWDFLVRQARTAGIVWWRDWSAQWQIVEPQQGRFTFSVPDAQIQRVLGLDSQVEVLLPFSAAAWSSAARPEAIEKAAGRNSYLRARLPMAFAPKNMEDFGKYAAEVVRHYRQARPHAVTHYQLLNEPLYTNYSLPRQFGYKMVDYLRLVEVASRAMKAADPNCRIVGGISAGLRASLTRDFITEGGLRLVDVVDYHIYDAERPVASYEESFRNLADLMRAHGGPKPVWITEWGCYADDDPPSLPATVGDDTMNRCRWPSERAATEYIVKFTALSFAHGVRKIFFHAGTCGTINGPDAGGVLFEYGGTPRKMYAGVAALTKWLGVPQECVQIVKRNGVRAYIFRTANRLVAVAWSEDGPGQVLKLPPNVTAYDIMGNEVPRLEASLSEAPLYLTGPTLEEILKAL